MRFRLLVRPSVRPARSIIEGVDQRPEEFTTLTARALDHGLAAPSLASLPCRVSPHRPCGFCNEKTGIQMSV